MNPITLSNINYAMDHAFSCNEIFDHIMSYIPEKNAYGYGRVENTELSLKIIRNSWKFRCWFCCSEKGPYKFSGKTVVKLIGDTPLPLRAFLGKMNLMLVDDVKASFQNLDKITICPSLHTTLKIYPYVKNFQNQTPIDLSIPLLLNDRKIYQFLLDGLYEEADVITLLEALPKIFIDTLSARVKNFELADVLIEKIIIKMGSDKLAIDILQPHLGKIISFRSLKDLAMSYKWIKNKGFRFTTDALHDFFINSCTCIFNQEVADAFFEIMEEIYDSENVALDTPLHNGNHLIHGILLNPIGRNNRRKHIELILKKAPYEVQAENNQGQPFICMLFREGNQSLIPRLNLYLNESVLWKQKEACHQLIMVEVKAFKIKHCVFTHDNQELLILIYLGKIKKLFSSNSKFEEWLISTSHNGDCLLHQMARWSSTLIDNMLKLEFFTADKLELKDRNNQTVQNLQNLYKRLVEISKGCQDMDALRQIIVEIPELIKSQFLYRLFKLSFFSNFGRHEHFMSDLIHFKGSNFRDKNGNTLLHRLFSKRYHSEMVIRMKPAIAFLIDRGADPTIKNKKKETVLDLAIRNGWENLLGMLKKTCFRRSRFLKKYLFHERH